MDKIEQKRRKNIQVGYTIDFKKFGYKKLRLEVDTEKMENPSFQKDMKF